MSSGKRKHLRRKVVQPVAILRADGGVLCECELRDVSDGGARLRLTVPAGSPPPTIPTEFVLSLSTRGNVFRNCRTVWQRADEVGVQFVKRAERP
jgi:hypothetical protein